MPKCMSAGLGLMIAFTAALALSACGGQSTPGVLTQADIPNNLNLVANPSASVGATQEAGSERHCKKAPFAVFTAPGQAIPKANGISSMVRLPLARGPYVVSGDYSCTTWSDARTAFKSDGEGSGHPITGIGDEARLQVLSTNGRVCEVEWREANHFGAVVVIGSTNEKRLLPALTEMLARRAAARS